jgi:hypothetical protein
VGEKLKIMIHNYSNGGGSSTKPNINKRKGAKAGKESTATVMQAQKSGYI